MKRAREDLDLSGACGRADLVRALVRGDSALADALAGLLGFEVHEEPTLKPKPIVGTLQATMDVAFDAFVERASPEILAGPLIPIPFGRLEGYESVVPEEPGSERRQISTAPVIWRNRPDTPPAVHLLAPWRTLQLRLHTALVKSREGRAIDIKRIVRRLSCGQWLDYLPRKQCHRWGPRLQLVIDRSEHLVPYWTDQDQVRGELARLFTAQDLEQAVFHEGLSEPRPLGVSASDSYQPPLDGVVLVLGDLGCLTARAVDEDNSWLALGRRIIAAGSRPVALLPCPPERCPTILRSLWQLVPWERPQGATVTDRYLLRERAERLLRLVSPAVRIEPGFLRAVRLSLGVDEADAGTESDVWQHPAIASTHSDAATLDPGRAKELRAAFAAELPDCQRRILALLRAWRGHLPQEIWFEEIRDLSRVSLEVLPEAADVEDARCFFDSIGDRLEPTADGPTDTAIGAWMGRVRTRATDDFWTVDDVGARLLGIDWLRNRHRPDYRPPVPCDPTLLPPQKEQSERHYEVRQDCDELVVVPTPPITAVSATEVGSLLGTLRTINQFVQILSSPEEVVSTLRLDAAPPQDRCALPQAPTFMIRTDREHLRFCRLTKPVWASAIGRDRFGLWCEIAVEPKRGGEPVVQRLRWIPPGRFWMGSPKDEPGRYDDESPRHQVTLRDGYWLFDTPCTQALWEAVMGENPSRFKGGDRPVEQVSWNDAQDFLKRINGQIPGLALSLPSEAQWEYACRAGTETAIYIGDLDSIAWYSGNSESKTHPVKLKRANPWGLYDMLGNVWEWTQDHWHDRYEGVPTDGSVWLSDKTDAFRVLRGGSWVSGARYVRAAYRDRAHPDNRHDDPGFRCALVRGEPSQPAG